MISALSPAQRDDARREHKVPGQEPPACAIWRIVQGTAVLECTFCCHVRVQCSRGGSVGLPASVLAHTDLVVSLGGCVAQSRRPGTWCTAAWTSTMWTNSWAQWGARSQRRTMCQCLWMKRRPVWPMQQTPSRLVPLASASQHAHHTLPACVCLAHVRMLSAQLYWWWCHPASVRTHASSRHSDSPPCAPHPPKVSPTVVPPVARWVWRF